MKCLRPIRIGLHDTDVGEDYFKEFGTAYISVPCNKCTACLANKRNEWVFRLHEHMQVCDTAYFVTLTYDDEHLPSNESLDKDSVKIFLHSFINRSQRHYQSELKKLGKTYDQRKILRPHIKYFLVGEYGDSFERPHYHFALFDFPGDKETLTRILMECWHNASIVPDVRYLSIELIRYVTKYMLKEFTETLQEHYEKLNKEPPFRLMSKGLGKSFCNISQAKRFIHSDGKPVKIYSTRFAYPKYYRDKLTKMYYHKYNAISPNDKSFYHTLGLMNVRKKVDRDELSKKYPINFNTPENIDFQMNLRNKINNKKYGK